MKRTLSFVLTTALLLMLMLTGMFSITASAATDGYYTYTVSGGKATITDCNTSISGDITIPSTLGGYPVTEIGYNAFNGCSSLTSIVIPDSVTSIGSYAFDGCDRLAQVVYCGTAEQWFAIEKDSSWDYEGDFSVYCTDITDAEAEQIASYLSNVKEDVKTLRGKCSAMEGQLAELEILISLHLSDCDKSSCEMGQYKDEHEHLYGMYAYFKNTVEKFETAIDSLENAEKLDLRKLEMLTTELPEFNDRYIGGDVIYADILALDTDIREVKPHIASVVIPAGDTAIDSWEFENYADLTSITIPESVTSIGRNAFYGCTNLTNITFQGTMAQWNAIAKGDYWDSYTGSYTIYCTNGEIAKDGTITCKQHQHTATVTAPTATEDGYTTYCCPNCGDTYTQAIIPTDFTVTSDNRAKIGYTGEVSESLVIPAVFQDGGVWYRVTGIGDAAFNFCESLWSVTIPESVTGIGRDAFYGCSSLRNIVIPEGVVSIGGSAFNDCWNLQNITIPDSVTYIGSSAFWGCGFTSITISDSITTIEAWTFENCTNMTSITIPDGVTGIGKSAFACCFGLTDVTIPDSVTSIGNNTFENCNSLKSITFQGTMAQWNAIAKGDDWDSYTGTFIICCTDGKLTKDGTVIDGHQYVVTVTAPTATEDGYAVYCCSICGDTYTETIVPIDFIVTAENRTKVGYTGEYQEHVEIPAVFQDGDVWYHVTGIADSAFWGCGGIDTVIIPNSVTSIGASAFYCCNSLNFVTIGNGVVSIGASAFEGCYRLVGIYYNGTLKQWNAIAKESNWNAGTGSYTTYCTDCETAKDGTITCKNHHYVATVTAPTATENGYTTYCCPNCDDSYTEAIVPIDFTVTADNRTKVGYTGEVGESLVIPAVFQDGDVWYRVTGIGNDAFLGCSSLTSITIPDSVTCIESSAFRGCSSLTSITIPDSVTRIESSAFRGCSSLTGIWVDENNSVYSSDPHGVLFNKNKTELMIAPGGLSGVYAIPNSVTSIGKFAFLGCSSLTSIVIPEGVTNIGGYAFFGCSGLTSIVIPEGVTSIGYSAFDGCSSLTDVYYTGTREQWDAITINSYNTPLLSANLTVDYHDCAEYEEWIITKAPTFISAGEQQCICTKCGEITTTEVLEMLVGKVSQWNVALADDLLINFYMNISESIESTAKVRIYVGEKAYTFPVSALQKTEDGLYVAKVSAAAAQMSDSIIVMVMNNGIYSETQVYTIRQYADAILTDETHSRYHALVREMLNYGAAAQIYFDYEIGNLANGGITGAGSAEIPESLDDGVTVSGSAEGIFFYGASLIFRDRIAVRYYFSFEGKISNMAFTADGLAYAPQLKDGLYYVEIPDILPQNLDQSIVLSVTDANGDMLTVQYNPMSYIVRMNEKGSADLQNLLKALYNYHLAAKALQETA